jgi:hypothetical protein
MPRNERRYAHRYEPARDAIRLGWWQGQQFRSIPARLRNLSLSGAIVQLDGGAVAPAGVKAWLCLADESPTHWVQAEIVEVCQEIGETPCVLRLKFLDAFPYESFKRSVWDDGLAERKQWPDANHEPPALKDADSTRGTNHVTMTESERIRFFLQLDTQPVASSGRRHEVIAQASPHPPTLLEAYRSQMAAAGKVASFPWLVVLLIGLSVSILLGILATGHMVNLQRLGIILGLNE